MAIFDPTDGTISGPVTDISLGQNGKQGDILDTVLLTPIANSPGDVSIKDGPSGTAIIIRKGGFAFFILGSAEEDPPVACTLKVRSRVGAWLITIGAGWKAKITGSFS